jgi:hypothetical protein
MKIIRIKIHSFVDLITNSSSEVFVSATYSTVQTAKDIINNLTNYKCDELFEIKLVYSEYDYETKTYKDIEIDSDEGRIYEEENTNEFHGPEQVLRIKPLNSDPNTINVAQKIEKFFSTYETIGYYNG